MDVDTVMPRHGSESRTWADSVVQKIRVSAISAAVGGLVVAVAPFATAATLSSIGDDVEVQWELLAGNTDPNGNTNDLGQDLTFRANFSIFDFIDVGEGPNTGIRLRVEVENTTADQGNEVGIQELGVGTDPLLEAVTLQNEGALPPIGSDFDKFISAVVGSSPELVNNAVINLLSSTGTGAPNTLREQQTDIFFLDLDFTGADSVSAVTINPFDIKIQTIDPSFQLVGFEIPPGPTPNPEPATLALLGGGLIGLGMVARRRRENRTA